MLIIFFLCRTNRIRQSMGPFATHSAMPNMRMNVKILEMQRTTSQTTGSWLILSIGQRATIWSQMPVHRTKRARLVVWSLFQTLTLLLRRNIQILNLYLEQPWFKLLILESLRTTTRWITRQRMLIPHRWATSLYRTVGSLIHLRQLWACRA